MIPASSEGLNSPESPGGRGKQAWRILRAGSVANQITLAFWLVYIPALGLTSTLISSVSQQRLTQEKLNELRVEALLINSKIQGWQQLMEQEIESLALSRNLLQLSRQQQNALLKQASPEDTDSNLTLYNNQGYALATSRSDLNRLNEGNLAALRQEEIRKISDNRSEWAKKRIEFSNGYLLTHPRIAKPNKNTGHGSIYVVVALYNQPNRLPVLLGSPQPTPPKTSNPDIPDAFLTYSVPLDKFVAESELDTIENLISLGTVTSAANTSARSGNRLPSFALATPNGNLLFAFTASGQLLARNQFNQASPAWQQLWRAAKNPCKPERASSLLPCQLKLNYANAAYIVNYQSTDSGLTVITTLPAEVANEQANQLARRILVLGGILLLLGTLVMRYLAQKLAEPIEEASRTVMQLSKGDFAIDLKLKPRGELADLYRNLNNTAERLKRLLKTEKEAAVSIQEIETAKSIQRNFLPAQISTCSQLALAAICEPALNVGADWYDVIPVEQGTVLVLADVCDKGVGSALFMSVFRSLIRFFVQQTFKSEASAQTATAATEESSPEVLLEKVISQVNNYMVENHAQASMFATIFLALHQPQQQRLVALNAGHEATLLMAGQDQTIQQLSACGPAVGIFAGARYKACRFTFHPGDWLLLYSDGLPDTTNNQGSRFGHQRTEQIFIDAVATINRSPGPEGSCGESCEQVLQAISESVEHFRQDQAPFDDLTIMVARSYESNRLPSMVITAATTDRPVDPS